MKLIFKRNYEMGAKIPFANFYAKFNEKNASIKKQNSIMHILSIFGGK